MIVGKLPVSVLRSIEVYDGLLHVAQSQLVETHSDIARPFGDCWITCCQAMPHVDGYFWHLMFLNLAVVSSHEFGQADMPRNKWHQVLCDDAGPGVLFMTDPRKLHWLSCRPFEEGDSNVDRPQPYVGIQWEIPRRGWKARVRAILKEIGAIPEPEWMSPPSAPNRAVRP